MAAFIKYEGIDGECDDANHVKSKKAISFQQPPCISDRSEHEKRGRTAGFADVNPGCTRLRANCSHSFFSTFDDSTSSRMASRWPAINLLAALESASLIASKILLCPSMESLLRYGL